MLSRIYRRAVFEGRKRTADRRNRQLVDRLGSAGRGVRFAGRSVITGAGNAHFGDNVHIGDGAYIRAEGGLEIGSNTHVSRNMVLYTMNHDIAGTALPYDDSQILRPVKIGRNVWIGMNVCIIPGTTIGDGAVIGMGTVVFGEVPPMAIVGSQPWRIIGERDEDLYRELDAAGRYGGSGGKPFV